MSSDSNGPLLARLTSEANLNGTGKNNTLGSNTNNEVKDADSE